ncbi:hypothetical protein AOQ84DRAFT_437874 [Glonium stellatum]|uniref:CFEM domain-containing protein n=1 Tax=Glonium stellatum TaxID=574774 RepID=A0A8E2F5Z3_9PEZI|nr:hypothetical protein AOQ84DRAFT_437874 [Glonium stellatum]
MFLTILVLSLLTSARLSFSSTTTLFDSLPSCAQTCTLEALSSTSCLITDTACFCQSASYHQKVACCIRASCDSADVTSASNIEVESCNSVGISLSRLPDSACSTTFAAAAATTAYTYGTVGFTVGDPGYTQVSVAIHTQASVPSQPQNSAVSPSSASNPSDQKQKSSLPIGAIVGIAVGVGISCLGLGALAVLFIWRRRQNMPAPAQVRANVPATGPTNHGNELGGKGITITAEKQVWVPPPHTRQRDYNYVAPPPELAPPGPETDNPIPPNVNGYPGGCAYSHELSSHQNYQQPQQNDQGATELPSPEGLTASGQQRHELHSGQL